MIRVKFCSKMAEHSSRPDATLLLVCQDPELREIEEKKHLATFSPLVPKLHIAQFDRLLGQIASPELFSPKVVVIFRDVHRLPKGKLQLLAKHIGNLPIHVCLVLTAEKIDKRGGFYKTVGKKGKVVDIPQKKPWEMEPILAEEVIVRARQEGVFFERSLALQLVRWVGNHQLMLAHEVVKLITYLGDRKKVTLKDLQAIATSTNQESTWKLVDAIFADQTQVALKILHSLFQDGVSLFLLLKQIRSQFHQKLMLLSLSGRPNGSLQIAKRFPHLKGTFLQKQLQSAKKMDIHRLKKGILTLDSLDGFLKSQVADEAAVGELAIYRLTQ